MHIDVGRRHLPDCALGGAQAGVGSKACAAVRAVAAWFGPCVAAHIKEPPVKELAGFWIGCDGFLRVYVVMEVLGSEPKVEALCRTGGAASIAARTPF